MLSATAHFMYFALYIATVVHILILVYIKFIPHCHGNGLVNGGVYSGYTCDYLISSMDIHTREM